METSKNAPDSLLDRLAENARKYPNKTAVTFLSSGPNGGKVESQLTYSELAQETTALALRLIKSGLRKGDRAVLVYPPSLDFMTAFLACLKAGIIAVPVFPPNPSRPNTLDMFSRIVDGCGAKHALTSVSYNHAKKLSSIKDTLVKRKRPTGAWPEQLKWIVTNDGSTSKQSSTPLDFRPVANDVAFLQYTSGSTSDPKGVMITYGNLGHNLTIITNELNAGDDTIVVSWLPQYHDMGLIGSYLGVLYCGGSGYYMSPLAFLQRPIMWIEAVSKYKATHLQAPNFAFKLTARKYTGSEPALDLSSVRHVINAAEPVDENSIDSFVKAFSKHGFDKNALFPTYGLAEHTVFVCSGGKQRLTVSKEDLEVNGVVKIVDDSFSSETSRLIGCGYPSRQGVDVKIANQETHAALKENMVGEIWINSPSKAAGYWDNAEVTKEDFHAQLKGSDESDGYLRTGDLGFLHNDELFICGRLKDLIIVAGRNYYPQDIEATAEASSALLRPGCSAAFTIDPTHEGGEEVALVAEIREVPTKKEIDEVCGQLADAIRSAVNQEHSLGLSQLILLRPRTIPKTSSGKIARAWCRKALITGNLDSVYRKSFKPVALEIEQMQSASAPVALESEQIEALRAMDRKQILGKLCGDVSKIGSVPPDSIDVNVSLVSILDSLSISQFKGLLEAEYTVKISDEYLFRESTSLTKLVEVVKLGHAPDDDGETPVAAAPPSNTGGIAGALGCPPGVVCCVVM